jgi:agmatine deiminase
MADFLMPAEWAEHKATLLAWPHNKEDWPGKFEPIPYVFAEIIRNLTAHERVWLLIRNEKDHRRAIDVLERSGVDLKKIDFFNVPTDRIWMRDAGPILVNSGKKKVMLDWRFNAWAKYPNHKKDDKIPATLAGAMGYETVQPMHKGKRVVLEGGAIDVNGKGTLITTEECLLSKKRQVRNPGFTRDDYEEVFAKYLGIDNVLWMENGIVGDDTHGHVDDITRFVSEDTIITCVEPDKKDPNHKLLQENVNRLKKTKFNVVELPMPKPVIFEGERLPASYANFLIANKQVLVPTFNDANDRLALNILAECFKGRDIIPIHSLDFVWGLGTIHCASQQITN